MLSDFGLRYAKRARVAGSQTWSPCLVVHGHEASGPRKAAYVRDGYEAFPQPKFECGCCEMLVFMICDARQNLYVFTLYRNPGLDDRIFNFTHIIVRSAG